ncbi:anti-sigma factor [Leekyejoonella antrihumi]|uniref:Putative zinc-finger domain-containing protein n=1 Tax=Leekyejoonella antrihumi TaxID=1660198 RepID=A0A563DUU8_9MICO|nr:zf-HC2 domain-containing protein [Leekyejoonella antrihumi]TWP33731.1 hypothetical protein FGL98_20030 [Leekyejoonella antrihumi]
MTGCGAHPDDLLPDYVDGLLSDAEEHAVERHLIACQHCCARVHQERELIARLRAVHLDAGHHQQLMAGLLSLAGDEGSMPREPAFADIRATPAMMTTHAPAQYLSARRSVAFTLAAVAGCLGAALTVSQVPQSTASSDGSGSVGGTATFSRSVSARHATSAWPDAAVRSSGGSAASTRVSSISVSVPGR